MTTKPNKYEIPMRSDEFLQSDAVCEELEIEVTTNSKKKTCADMPFAVRTF